MSEELSDCALQTAERRSEAGAACLHSGFFRAASATTWDPFAPASALGSPHRHGRGAWEAGLMSCPAGSTVRGMRTFSRHELITEDLTWAAHTDAVLKKAHQRLFFLRRLRKFGTSPRILRSFYTCTVESILTGCITAWFGNSTAGNRRALQRVVRTARHIVGGELPSLQDIYTRRCTRKARRIIKDSSHPSHRLLSLLPSGRRFRSIRSRTSRLRDSFFPQAIRLMNSHK